MFPCLNIHKFCLFCLMIAMCTECLYCISLIISSIQLHSNDQLSHGICNSPGALSGHYHLKLHVQIPPLSSLYSVRNSVSYGACLADKRSLLLQQWHNCYKSSRLLFKIGFETCSTGKNSCARYYICNKNLGGSLILGGIYYSVAKLT